MGLKKFLVFDSQKHLVLDAPSEKEAEWAFDELQRAKLYKNKKIEWQFSFLEDAEAIGRIV